MGGIAETAVAEAERVSVLERLPRRSTGLGELRRDTVANLIGRGSGTLLAVLCTPVYLRLLGVEAYGLIGFFATLQGIFGIFDLGLSTTLNRELARLSRLGASAGEQRDLVRTLEVLYWAIAGAICIAVVTCSPWLASHWVHPERLSVRSVESALRVMGFVLA